MLTYLVDGYNLLFYLSHASASIQKQREHLIDLFRKVAPLFKGNIILIFDGSSSFASWEYFSSFQLEFAPGDLKADAYILEKLSGTKRPSQYVVVTADKLLARECKHLGASVLALPSFLKKMKKAYEVSLPEEKKPLLLLKKKNVFKKFLRVC